MNEKNENKKWADYLISAVRYQPETDNRIIAYLKVHNDEMRFVGKGRTWSRTELLDALENGKSIATIRQDKEGKWVKCHNISLSSYNESFIHSDVRNIPGDYLENVEEF